MRPALVLYEGESDVIVAFISSKIPSKRSKTDIVIDRKNKEFANIGLKVPSVIKLDKVATILKDLIVGEIGYVGEELKKEINSKSTGVQDIECAIGSSNASCTSDSETCLTSIFSIACFVNSSSKHDVC